jgi:hypothetical protein
LKLYVGLREMASPVVFESEKEPDKDTHPQFDIIFGPFKSREDAEKYITAMGRGVACGEG